MTDAVSDRVRHGTGITGGIYEIKQKTNSCGGNKNDIYSFGRRL